ncbi:MAG: heavy metal-binding domain-containing protein, partial [Fidelibacterota bacterium]
MKPFLLILGPVLVLGILACAREKEGEGTETSAEERELAVQGSELGKVLYYTCPMESHKHVHSGEEGTCPDCGMTLIPVVQTAEADAEFYG